MLSRPGLPDETRPRLDPSDALLCSQGHQPDDGGAKGEPWPLTEKAAKLRLSLSPGVALSTNRATRATLSHGWTSCKSCFQVRITRCWPPTRNSNASHHPTPLPLLLRASRPRGEGPRAGHQSPAGARRKCVPLCRSSISHARQPLTRPAALLSLQWTSASAQPRPSAVSAAAVRSEAPFAVSHAYRPPSLPR